MTRCVMKRKASDDLATMSPVKRLKRTGSAEWTGVCTEGRKLKQNAVLAVQEGFYFHVPAEYTRLAYLAEGAFGVVCTALRYGEEVVVKKIHCKNAVHAESALRELHNVAWFATAKAAKRGKVDLNRHNGIVKIRDCWMHEAEARRGETGPVHLYLALDKYDLTLDAVAQKRLTGPRWREVAKLLIEAVHTMHRVGSFHRDLKPENVVVKADLSELAIIDLGSIRQNEVSVLRPLTPVPQVTTEGFRAPESVFPGADEAEYDAQVDIFAVGCVLAHLRLGKQLFRDEDDLRAYAELDDDAAAAFVDQAFRTCRLSKLDASVFHGLLARDPAARLTSEQLLDLLNVSSTPLHGEYAEPDYPATNTPDSHASILDNIRTLIRGFHKVVKV
eukprot:TRINITY_DN32700_c0_g1_i1.p2 TRINITY_DN32700_c0_g1~~TRINITY_DN32700_c0_g1_i1.p2  ORF type:complete len:388 (+),score=162.12 TRINITY_DN32700_c0_g1_i1:58-1221(+)